MNKLIGAIHNFTLGVSLSEEKDKLNVKLSNARNKILNRIGEGESMSRDDIKNVLDDHGIPALLSVNQREYIKDYFNLEWSN